MQRCGIYFLYDKKRLVYIGKTIHFPARLRAHRDKIYDRVRFITCLECKLDEYERRLISFFKPHYNKTFIHKKKPKAYSRPRRTDGMVSVRCKLPPNGHSKIKNHQTAMRLESGRKVTFSDALNHFILSPNSKAA